MSGIRFSCDWLPTGGDEPEIRDTSGRLSIAIDNESLTHAEDIWTRTVRDGVLVSAYPLALWLASSWWRLLYEPDVRTKGTPPIDWRMSHELGAANHGYVWPNIAFATDGEAVQIEARASSPDTQQSVRYLNSLSAPARVSVSEFEREIEKFIGSVVARLQEQGHSDTELSSLWSLVQKDRSNADIAHIRRLEALLGYDQEECPDELLENAQRLEKHFGKETFSELAPAYGATQGTASLDDLFKLEALPGLTGTPKIDLGVVETDGQGKAPWACAVATARNLRKAMRHDSDLIPDSRLYALLGLNSDSVANWKPPLATQKVAVAAPIGNGMFKFKPRKDQLIAQRFEFARFIGDLLASKWRDSQWLASTDSVTWRQKFQRAFAAEFLCPIDLLIGRLKGEDSRAAIRKVAPHFQVSYQTVFYLLANKKGYLRRSPYAGDFLYRRSV